MKNEQKTEFKKKPLYIFVGLKGGLGKSKIAKHLFSIVVYNQVKSEIKDKLKFNVVEIDDSATVDIWSSDRVICKSFDVADYKDAINQVQKTWTDSNTVEIIDIGSGGVKINQLLLHISKMRLEDIFDVHFFVPTNRDSLIFDSCKTTLSLINQIFNKKSTLIYNRVIQNLEDEFQVYFGNQKWNIKSRFEEITGFVEAEWVIPEDRLSLVENAINETRKSALDFYINANNCVVNFMQNRINALEDENKLNKVNTMYDIAYDYLEFFKQIKFEVKR